MTTAVPSPLVSIVVLNAVSMGFGLDVRTVSDLGELPSSLPVSLLPDIPLNLDTVMILLPYAIPLAIVGLLESLLTASIVDDLTDTGSNKDRESTGQGIANVATSFLGGMAGCAMIGQSMINVRSGGRGRLSTFVAGAFLLVLVFGFGDALIRNPILTEAEGQLLMIGKGTDTEQERLNAAAFRLREAGYTITATLRSGDPDHLIADTVEAENMDLLVIGAYGHSRIRTLMIGSTTTAVLRTTAVSTLVIR